MIAAALASLALSLPDSGCAASLEQARMAYATFDIVSARSKYAEVNRPDCPPGPRGDAEVELARLAWLVDGAAAVDLDDLRATVASHPQPCMGARLLARVLVSARRLADAHDVISAYSGQCSPLDAAFSLEAELAVLREAADADGAARERLLVSVRHALDTAGPLAAISPTGARVRLDLGLLSGSADEAMVGWRAFYWLENGLAPAGFGPTDQDIHSAFELGVNASDDGARARLAALLVRAGFADEAKWLASRSTNRLADTWRSVNAYLTMRERLTTVLLEHDRARARDTSLDDSALESRLLDILRTGLIEAGHEDADLWPTLEAEWNLIGISGVTNGVRGLHLGHASIRRDDHVSQGGRTGEVRFASLDNMVANGFSAWVGDGAFATGGWTSDGRIIQVRQRYVDGALALALSAGEGPARAAVMRRIEASQTADVEAARSGSIVYLPSVADRLRLQAIDDVAGEVRAEASEDRPFEVSFARRWYDRSFESAVLLHEGRHALDEGPHAGDAVLDSPELEYRAKISEVGLSETPRVGMMNVYSRLLGGSSGHGVANARLISDLVGWMQRHPDEITSFDPGLSSLAQLPLLTNAQLREAVLAQDPERSAAPPTAPASAGHTIP